jgi:hypothetical protein
MYIPDTATTWLRAPHSQHVDQMSAEETENCKEGLSETVIPGVVVAWIRTKMTIVSFEGRLINNTICARNKF